MIVTAGMQPRKIILFIFSKINNNSKMIANMDAILPILLEMNTTWGSRIISVLEKEVSSNHKIDSAMLGNNDD